MSQAYNDDFNVRCSALARDYSSILYRRRPSSAFSSPLDRASHSLRSSRRTTRIRHDVTSGRNACAGWTVVVWKGTLLRDPPRRATPRREDGAKTSFVRLFRGKVFRDESTHFARTNDACARGSGS